MTFSEYVAAHFNKAVNNTEVAETPVVNQETKNEIDYLKELDAHKWNAKIINDEKFLFFNGHFVNISKLKNAITDVYSKNGYSNYGYSKLDESELIRYSTVKNIIIKEFMNDNNVEELDPLELAEEIFRNEYTGIEWKPAELSK